ncbi:hypothetical protein [Mesotoga sp.]|uniref:hypothetical protein n=1 Tax=Mesotoga sp. TaxID=2053577 RepID=UPI00345E203D
MGSLSPSDMATTAFFDLIPKIFTVSLLMKASFASWGSKGSGEKSGLGNTG